MHLSHLELFTQSLQEDRHWPGKEKEIWQIKCRGILKCAPSPSLSETDPTGSGWIIKFTCLVPLLGSEITGPNNVYACSLIT